MKVISMKSHASVFIFLGTLLLKTVLLTIVLTASLSAQENAVASPAVALTPPMGWNSWNKFGCNVSDEMIRGMADAMVKSGMKDAGYQYVNVDDCWQVSRDANGNIVADPQRFPTRNESPRRLRSLATA